MAAYRALALLLLASSSRALAADQLSFGPAPAWVNPKAIPTTSNAPAEAPVGVLLNDQQIKFEPGKTTIYVETAIKIQNGQGLAAGNVSLPWDPATDSVTVHKLHIVRGDQTIDVLKNGQTFTTLRREQNLDAAMLDGRLTANIQPEGLQEGDVLVLATSLEHRDPVLKDHIEAQFANWNGVPFKSARVRLLWPSRIKLKVQQANLPSAKPVVRGGETQLEIAMEDGQPLIVPSGAPLRFTVGRYGEASDFASWAEVAELIAPHYLAASIIPASGALRDEVEKIRRVADRRQQVEQALALVQERVRYVALLMGEGGYVPASAESTWSRRFGDCKGKTALLLGILHELGIKADAVLVNTRAGDVLPDRLPMLGVFDHVLVRAEMDGQQYWLDGTRTGDASLAELEVPYFRWGLPVVSGARLVRIVPTPLTVPDTEVAVTIDATAGVYAPAPFKVERTIRGDPARATHALLSKLAPAQLEQTQKAFWKQTYDYVTLKNATFTFDKKKAELRLAMTGEAKLEWKEGWFYVPNSNLAYEPDFERTAGVNRDAPYALAFPNYERSHVELRLPPSFATLMRPPVPVKETLAGVEYARTVTLKDGMLALDRSERTVAPEIAYKDALAASGRLKTLSDEDVYLRIPPTYRMTDGDKKARLAEKPTSAQAYIDRGLALLDSGKQEEAIADFTEAVKLDPKNPWALANRGIAKAWAGDTKAAEADIAAAEALQPDNPVVSRARGLIAEKKGEFAAAVAAYDKSLKQEPGNDFAVLRRAAALQMLGKSKEALDAVNQIIAKQPQSDFVLSQRALAYVSQADYEAAEKDAVAALAINPVNPVALRVRAQVARIRGDLKAAVELYAMAVAKDPADDHARTELAESYRALGQDDKALAETEAALKTADDTSELRLLRANIFIARGDSDAVAREADLMMRENAESDFAQVAAAKVFATIGRHREVGLAFDRAIALTKEAYVYINRAQTRPWKDFQGRLADLDRALEIDPHSMDAYGEKARLLTRKGDFDEALKVYELAATEGAPSDPFAVGQMKDRLAVGRAYILNKAGRTAEAEKILVEQQAKAKTFSDFSRLCSSKSATGVLLESALADCREALKLNPDTAGVRESLALVLLRLGKLDDALAEYDRAIARNKSSEAFMGRSVARSRKGDSVGAKADRSEALKRDPLIEDRFAEYGVQAG